ncbi:MAG: potassium channel family protein [Desulfurococcales archaeon]|nr:potassium channel family protein [Desulfurococcales archaeon]
MGVLRLSLFRRVANGNIVEIMEHPLVEASIAYASLLSVVLAIVDITYPLTPEARLRLYLVDLAIVSLLIADYAYRAWRSGDWRGYVRSTFYELPALIPVGLLALLESYLAGLGVLRLLRLVRVIRLILIVSRGSRFLSIVESTAGRLKFLYILGFAAITLYFGALAIYFVESPIPESQIKDFSTALWWAVVTATTVGYGDVVPVTPLGKMIGVLMMIVGIASLSATVGIIATSLAKALEEEEENYERLCHEIKRLGEMERDDLELLLRMIEREWEKTKLRKKRT